MIFNFSTCRKSGINCAENVYSFEARAKILNHSDSINVGDTVWLEVTCPVSQSDGNSGRMISYSKAANLGTAIAIGELVKPSGIEAASSFDYHLVTGTNINNPDANRIREYLFSEGLVEYQFLVGIIPKKKGIFSIGLSNAANVYRTNDKCTKASYRIYFTQTDQHLYFIKQVYGVDPDPPPNGTYCFKVK